MAGRKIEGWAGNNEAREVEHWPTPLTLRLGQEDDLIFPF